MALKEYLDVTITEKELIEVELNVIDVLQSREIITVSGLVEEVPTKLTATRFQTSQVYVTGSLKVFLNGIKVHIVDITEESSQIFTIIDSTIIGDVIETEYLIGS